MIEPGEAEKFIKRMIIGDITKKQLDKARSREVSEMDFMENQTIVHHSDSILELQIFGLLMTGYINNSERKSMWIFYALMAHHIIAYVMAQVRRWETTQYG